MNIMFWPLLLLFFHLEMVLKVESRRLSGTPKYQIERRSEGSTLKLLCRVKGYNARWFREGKKIETERQPRYTFRKKGKMLVITRLRKTDAGDFICKDKRMRKPTAHFKVIVTETSGKPVFVDLPKMKRLQLSIRTHGDKVQFLCTAEGEMPIYYKWLKDGKPLKVRRVSNRMNASHPVLKLNDLVLSDNGNYTCMVSNKFGKIQHKFQLTVIESTKSRPYLKPGHPRNRTLRLNENTTLNCYDILGGMGMADFRWLNWTGQPPDQSHIRLVKNAAALLKPHNGTLIETKYYQTSILTVSGKEHHGVALPLIHVTEQDAGWYSCIACNFIGCSIESAFVKVTTDEGKTKQKPSTQTKVPCLDQKKTSVCQNYMNRGFCDNIKFRHFFMANCKKTCKFCDIDKTYPCGISKVRQRSGINQIIGGKTATKGAWPWQVALYKNNKFQCGGTLVNRRFIVSAAHCFKSRVKSSYYVVLGEHNRKLAEGTEQIVRLKNIIVHPGYIPKVANDLAIVELERDAMLSTYITTACLPREGEEVAPGTKCFMSGWGRKLITQGSATVLQEAPMSVLTHAECAKQNRYTIRQVLPTMICAKNTNNFWTSGCHGDSGGPLVCENQKGRMVLHGAVSWGSSTCDALDHHTVFSRISSFIPWIKQNTKM